MCLAVPSKVVLLDKVSKTGKVDHLGTRIPVDFALLDQVKIGDWVIVHAGFAISKLDRAEARKTLDLFREIEDRE